MSPLLQIRSTCINLYNNLLPGRVTIEEIPIWSTDDNTFTPATILSTWVTDWTRSYGALPTPGSYEYYQWPTTHTYENHAFWQNRGVVAGKSRVLSIPGGCVRTSKHTSRWTNYNYAQWTSLTAGNLMTAKKTKWFHYSVMGSTMNTCDVIDDMTTQGLPNPVKVSVNFRQIIKYQYRWLNENITSLYGEIRPTTYVPDAPYDAPGVGPGRHQMWHTPSVRTAIFPDASALDLMQQVNINPNVDCAGDPFIPTVDDPVA